MAISFRRYIDITSGVGGAGAVRQRDLIGRLFTTNPLLPTKSYAEFESADDVLAYFGSGSEEYARAAFYFGWISKNITAARKISFARWVDEDVAPRIYGKKQAQLLATFTSITDGALALTLGATENTMTGMNFSAAASLADVASIIQTAIRTKTGSMWTAATVAWNASRQSFDFVGGDTGVAVVEVGTAGSGTDVAPLIGWLTGAILSNGADEEAIADTLADSAEASNNFGSFLFLPALTIDQITEAATWNDTQNVFYHYTVPVAAADAASWSAALIGLSGASLTLAGPSGEYHEMVPMIILAATDYTKRNATQNYMFQQFTLTPTVTTNADADTYDPLRVNYYGRTQTAGQLIDFYQRGVMMGLATDPVDQNVYANEQWLKDTAAAALMTLLMALAKVSANAQGRSQLVTTLQTVVEQALFNGVISVGGFLNNAQKLFIAQITGDQDAWRDVQGIGYWLDVTFESYVTEDSRTEYKAVYTLLYKKDDAIRKVEGTHILV